MIRFKCNGEPYVDPWHKPADIISNTINSAPLTLETMMAAIDKLNEPARSALPKGHPLCGVVEVKQCAWMKGMEVIVVSGDKAYCWPDGLAGKEVKVIRIPEYKPEELKIDWSF